MNSKMSFIFFILSYMSAAICVYGDAQDNPNDATNVLLASIRVNDHALARDAIVSGADIEWRNLTGFTPLLMAADSGRVEVLSVLLRAGADLEAVGESSNRATHYAAASGRDIALALLAVAGAELNAAGYHDKTPVQLADEGGHDSTASLINALIKVKGERTVDGNVTRDLWEAVVTNDPLAASDAIVRGADIEWRNSTGFTPLHWASAEGHLEVMSVLLMAGAMKEAVDSDGDRPIHDAALFGRDEAVALLAVAGADLDSKGHSGRTALIRATINGKRSTAALLRSLGAWK